MKKYVICIPASDDFALATAVLIHSIKKNLRVAGDCDFVVPYNNLNEDSMNLIRKAHSETMFKPPRNSDFYKHIPRTIYGVGNFDVYLSFETFSQIGYKRSVYLDADMLCTGDFSDIIEDDKQIIWKFPNLGILVAGDKYLTGQAYDEMVKAVINTEIKNRPDGDQVTCQHFFSPANPDVKVISNHYNFQEFGGGGKGTPEHYDEEADKVKVIHYSGRRKPWGPIWDGDDNNKNCVRYATLMNENNAVKIWYKYYDDFREKCL
jgi:lipopolysaccharide biosynthesis glycosyltransferase